MEQYEIEVHVDAYWIIMHCCSELIGMVSRCSFNCKNRNSFVGIDYFMCVD